MRRFGPDDSSPGVRQGTSPFEQPLDNILWYDGGRLVGRGVLPVMSNCEYSVYVVMIQKDLPYHYSSTSSCTGPVLMACLFLHIRGGQVR